MKTKMLTLCLFVTFTLIITVSPVVIMVYEMLKMAFGPLIQRMM